MILRPSSVSAASSSAAGGAGAGGGGSTFAGSGAAAGVRIREMGGRMARLVSSPGARFGFGACGSISDTLSITGFGAAAGGGDGGAGGAGLAAGASGLFAVIGAKAVLDFGASTFLGGSAGLTGAGTAWLGGEVTRSAAFALAEVEIAPSLATGSTFSTLLVVFVLATGLAAAGRVRDGGLAALVFAAALRAVVFPAVDFVVAFVAIPKNSCAHGRERLRVMAISGRNRFVAMDRVVNLARFLFVHAEDLDKVG